MKCQYHPDEIINCLNINPKYQENRLLCIDCYMDQLKDDVPHEHVHKISKVPDLIISFLKIPDFYFHLNYRAMISSRLFKIQETSLILLRRQSQYYKDFDQIKKLVQKTADLLINQLDEYATQLQQLYAQYDDLNDYVWNYIGYEQIEAHLKLLIDKEPVSFDQYDQIVEDFDKLFKRINLESNDDFMMKYNSISQQYFKIKKLDILQNWRQNKEFCKQALNDFIQYQQKVYNIKIEYIPSKIKIQYIEQQLKDQKSMEQQLKENQTTIESLTNQINQQKQSRLCTFCKKREKNCAAHPCGHLQCCDYCTPQVGRQCRYCYKKTTSFLAVSNC